MLNNCLPTTQNCRVITTAEGRLDSDYKIDDKEGNGAQNEELQGKDKLIYKLFLFTFMHSCNHYEHVTSQSVDANLVSESSSALRNFTNGLEHLKHDQKVQSQELALVNEQLHLIQLALEDEK